MSFEDMDDRLDELNCRITGLRKQCSEISTKKDAIIPKQHKTPSPKKKVKQAPNRLPGETSNLKIKAQTNKESIKRKEDDEDN